MAYNNGGHGVVIVSPLPPPAPTIAALDWAGTAAKLLENSREPKEKSPEERLMEIARPTRGREKSPEERLMEIALSNPNAAPSATPVVPFAGLPASSSDSPSDSPSFTSFVTSLITSSVDSSFAPFALSSPTPSVSLSVTLSVSSSSTPSVSSTTPVSPTSTPSDSSSSSLLDGSSTPSDSSSSTPSVTSVAPSVTSAASPAISSAATSAPASDVRTGKEPPLDSRGRRRQKRFVEVTAGPAISAAAPATAPNSDVAPVKTEGPRYPEKSRAETWVLRDPNSPYCKARCAGGQPDVEVISIGEYETEDGAPARFGTIRIKCPPCKSSSDRAETAYSSAAARPDGFRTLTKAGLPSAPPSRDGNLAVRARRGRETSPDDPRILSPEEMAKWMDALPPAGKMLPNGGAADRICDEICRNMPNHPARGRCQCEKRPQQDSFGQAGRLAPEYQLPEFPLEARSQADPPSDPERTLGYQRRACQSMAALLPTGPRQRVLSERHIHYLFRNYNQYLDYDVTWAGEGATVPGTSVSDFFDFADECQHDVYGCMEAWEDDMVRGAADALSCLEGLFVGTSNPRIAFELHDRREPEPVRWEYDQSI